MINARYKNVPGVCGVCGKPLSNRALRYCPPSASNCYAIGRATLTQLQQRQLRQLISDNIKNGRGPNYKQVAREIGISPDQARHYWRLAKADKQATAQKKHAAICRANIAAAKSDLAREIAEAKAHPAEEPYKPERLWVYWSEQPAP